MLMAGGTAGTVSWVITYPIDVVKSRLQSDGMSGPRRYAGAWDCLKQSIRNEGYGFLSRGLTSTILRAFPMNAACFTVVTWTFRLCEGEVEAEAEAQVASSHDQPLLEKIGQALNGVALNNSKGVEPA